MKKFFFHVPKEDNRVLETKKTRYGMSLFKILFLVELSTCLQILIPTRGVENWEKNAEIHIQSLCFDNKKDILKKLY